MKANEFLKEIAGEACTSIANVDNILKALGVVVNKSLKGWDKVTIPGVAILSTWAVVARRGRNPQTGEPMDISGYTKVKYKTVKSLKDSIK